MSADDTDKDHRDRWWDAYHRARTADVRAALMGRTADADLAEYRERFGAEPASQESQTDVSAAPATDILPGEPTEWHRSVTVPDARTLLRERDSALLDVAVAITERNAARDSCEKRRVEVQALTSGNRRLQAEVARETVMRQAASRALELMPTVAPRRLQTAWVGGGSSVSWGSTRAPTSGRGNQSMSPTRTATGCSSMTAQGWSRTSRTPPVTCGVVRACAGRTPGHAWSPRVGAREVDLRRAKVARLEGES